MSQPGRLISSPKLDSFRSTAKLIRSPPWGRVAHALHCLTAGGDGRTGERGQAEHAQILPLASSSCSFPGKGVSGGGGRRGGLFALLDGVHWSQTRERRGGQADQRKTAFLTAVFRAGRFFSRDLGSGPWCPDSFCPAHTREPAASQSAGPWAACWF